MELLLSVVAFIVANMAFFYPGARASHPMQELLLVVLGVLILVQAFTWYRRRTAEPKPVPTPVTPPKKEPEKPAGPSLEGAVEAGVVQFLARLQEKGRFIDFLMDDIAPYSNEQIGVVSRVVHQGCREVLHGAFTIEPVHGGQEREQISLAADFDVSSYRLIGKVPEHPPYSGTILHRGWKATRISLPRVAEGGREAAGRTVIAPAEVEIG